MDSPATDPASEARQFALDTAQVARDNKAENVVVLDLRGLSSVADYFVLATGGSDRQMRAVLARIEELARGRGRRPYRTADSGGAAWMLADYVDVVVHVFDRQHRSYYDLDGLWGDAPRVE
jgi:ribosome-associated protein